MTAMAQPAMLRKTDQVELLLKEGKTPTEIAKMIGSSPNSVRVIASQLRKRGAIIPKGRRWKVPTIERRMQVTTSAATHSVLADHARRRGISPQAIARLILEVVALEQMVDAILDDGGDHD